MRVALLPGLLVVAVGAVTVRAREEDYRVIGIRRGLGGPRRAGAGSG